ncbi:MAG: energy-coupling factor ABC transporter permease [Acidimicrobiales bacterium]
MCSWAIPRHPLRLGGAARAGAALRRRGAERARPQRRQHGPRHLLRRLHAVPPRAGSSPALAPPSWWRQAWRPGWGGARLDRLHRGYALGGAGGASVSTVASAMVGVHVLIGIGEGTITALVVSAVLATRPDLVHGAAHLLPHRRLVVGPRVAPEGVA